LYFLSFCKGARINYQINELADKKGHPTV